MSRLSLLFLALAIILNTGCQRQPVTPDVVRAPYLTYPALLTDSQLLAQPALLAGIYSAYPGPQQGQLTPPPVGYEPFYISHYGRHGSRFQPSDSRYVDTHQRLLDAQQAGNLTPYGQTLLVRIQRLCDYACGHGGMLTTVGARQHQQIAQRMYQRFPQVFARHQHISARSSVVPRCVESMQSFVDQLRRQDSTLSILAVSDSADMRYLSYETPAQRQLSHDRDTWYQDYGRWALAHLPLGRLMDTLFVRPAGLDSLHTFADLYWLAAGMQNLDLDIDLSDVFTPHELLAAYRCVNHRMYITCGNSAVGQGIPASSATSLLSNIIQSADSALQSDSISCHLRFGHDSNLLRLLCLMHIHNAANSTADADRYLRVWQECILSPMAANLQLIFYRRAGSDVLVQILLNENETLLDAPLTPVTGPYYRWADLRAYLASQLCHTDDGDTEITVNIQ